MNFRYLKPLVLTIAAVAIGMSVSANAQDKPMVKPPAEPTASRWDIFAGYSHLAPHGTVESAQPVTKTGVQQTLSFSYNSVNVGEIGSVAYYFNRYVGAQAEIGVHEYDSKNNDGFTTAGAGLIFRYPTADITPFVHALAGGAYVDGPDHEAAKWGPALTVGGGMDYNTPLFHHKLAIRLFQADYEYIHEDFGPQVFGGRAKISAARLSAGLVLHVGSIAPPPPVTFACSASPVSVFAGEPVTITGIAGMLNPKLKPAYSFTGVAGLTSSEATATVATASLAPGAYTVKGTVTEGPKAGQSADCSASFTVKPFEPPTISCSANPTTIKPGDTSTVTAIGVSPQNRPLTYSYSASAGSVSGSGTSATFASAGAPSGTATVTCSVSDDKGQSATATASITIEAPYVPPTPKQSPLCSLSFDKDAKRPTRVDNEAKACLDDVALTLQKQSDATAALVGESTAAEKTPPKHMKKGAVVEDLAAQRAVNAKDYLVTEKGIDASRITLYTGTADDKKVEDYLVPAGATFSETGATKFTGAVKAQVRKPLATKHHAKKATK